MDHQAGAMRDAMRPRRAAGCTAESPAPLRYSLGDMCIQGAIVRAVPPDADLGPALRDGARVARPMPGPVTACTRHGVDVPCP
jgi:hypothetical protein